MAYCFAYVFLVIMACSLSGCGSSTGQSQQPDRAAAADESPSAKQCPDRCLHEAIYFGCAALGIDAAPSTDPSLQSADDVYRYLEDQARRQEVRMYRASVGEALKSLKGRMPCSTILVDSHGHLHVVVQRYGPDDAGYVQVAHGGGKGKLIEQNQLEKGEFVEAWLIDREPASIPIAVGTGKVVVEGFVQNLGEVPAGQVKSFHFKIRNEGQTPIQLARAQSSCACTTVEDVAGVRISRGSTYDLKVSLTAGEAESERQRIEVDFCSPRDVATVTRRFTVFSAQVPQAKPKP